LAGGAKFPHRPDDQPGFRGPSTDAAKYLRLPKSEGIRFRMTWRGGWKVRMIERWKVEGDLRCARNDIKRGKFEQGKREIKEKINKVI
jgi:hypothetical protein